MGEFDDRIAAFREQRKLALRDLEEIARGATYKRDGVDATKHRKERAEKIVRDIDAILVAYEDINAARP